MKLALTYEPVELAFGTSGLRGLVHDMTDLECYINVKGFLLYLSSIGHLDEKTVYIAGDLRDSTPRILRVVATAIKDQGLEVVYCGLIPTPAVAYYAQLQSSPCIMVTGSHIPADRNGIKFYKADGEVLKTDEDAIKQSVKAVRDTTYETAGESFDPSGEHRGLQSLLAIDDSAKVAYMERYSSVYGGVLRGKEIVLYEHSAVGRDMFKEILKSCGAIVRPVGRSETFVSIDTENVTPQDQAYFKELARDYPDCYAIVSTDGDSDRPFLIDEHGIFHRGDDLGAIVAERLDTDFAAYPVSANDGVGSFLESHSIPSVLTKIGSPYVIVAMRDAVDNLDKQRAVGWEVNGGFLLGSDIVVNDKPLVKLPTRDAFFPILAALDYSIKQSVSVSELFDRLPKRFTQAGLVDGFPSESYSQIKQRFATDTPENRDVLSRVFSGGDGFGSLDKIDATDGIRMYFENGDITHIRGSGNAPQLRVYSVADTQNRADEIVSRVLESESIMSKLAEPKTL